MELQYHYHYLLSACNLVATLLEFGQPGDFIPLLNNEILLRTN